MNAPRHHAGRTLLVAASLLVAPSALAQTVGPPAPTDDAAAAPSAPAIETDTPLGLPATSEERPIGEPHATGLGIGRTIGALGVVAGLALAAWFGVRTLARSQGGLGATLGAGGRAPSGVLEVLGRYPVGRGQTLVLLRVDRRVLLLSQTATGRLGTQSAFATLSEITDSEDVASILVKTRDRESEAVATRFRSLMGRFDQQHEAPYEGAAQIPVIDLTRSTDGPGAVLARFRRRWTDALGRAGGGAA
jgi:flagellar biogenesis protein FliO